MTEPSKALKTNNRLNAILGVRLRIRQEKNILSKMLKDVGIEVPKSIQTRCSMLAKAGDDNMHA